MTSFSKSILATASALSLFLTICLTSCLNQTNNEELAQRALVSAGDLARLQQVMAKARRGESITIGAIGGSITQGAKATQPQLRYINRITDWWKKSFPRAKFELVNAGIGATDSQYGAFRAQRDLLTHHPDFVIVDFAVNDKPTLQCAETTEGLVRQILRQPNQPAVMLLFMMKSTGENAQVWHSQVGAHYGLPMISYRDALWPEVQTKRIKWTDVSPDEVHPNDHGMALAADLITHFLAQTLKNLPTDDQLQPIPSLENPLFTDRYEHVALFEANDLRPVTNAGWSYVDDKQCWTSNQPGSSIEFVVPGESIALMFFRLRGSMGKASVQIDDGPTAILDAWFSGTWGGYRDTVTLGDHLRPGVHRVRLTLLDEKNPESSGHEFRIMGLGAAGVKLQ